ncbi:MAG: ribonuclease PH [Pirellulaceae bacterium]
MASATIRPVKIKRKFTRSSPGSVLYQCGETIVLCTASVQSQVPPWMVGKGTGWVTAEYNMLPHSTDKRKSRDRAGKVDGRTTEIQRLIGRSLRAVVDMKKLGERMVTVDCDVLQADGGTRTASITGGFLALIDALASEFRGVPKEAYPLSDSVAAISVGILRRQADAGLELRTRSQRGGRYERGHDRRGRFIEIKGQARKRRLMTRSLPPC